MDFSTLFVYHLILSTLQSIVKKFGKFSETETSMIDNVYQLLKRYRKVAIQKQNLLSKNEIMNNAFYALDIGFIIFDEKYNVISSNQSSLAHVKHCFDISNIYNLYAIIAETLNLKKDSTHKNSSFEK